MSGIKTLVIPDNNLNRLIWLCLIIAAAIIIGNFINIGIRYQRGRQLKAIAAKVSLIFSDSNSNTAKAENAEESVSATHSDTDSCRELLLSEIEEELTRIPRDIFVKGIAIILTLLTIIVWLVLAH